MEHSKKAIRSKTLWFNLLAIVSIILADEHFKEIAGDYVVYIFILQNLINMGLRFATTEPIRETTTPPKKKTSTEILNEANSQESEFLKDF